MKNNYEKRLKIWQGVESPEWCNWRWQMANRLTEWKQFQSILEGQNLTKEDFDRVSQSCRIALTPFLATTLLSADPDDALKKQFIPTLQEMENDPVLPVDPLCEDADSPVSGIVHRYDDRVLFLITDKCASYCRYCNRRRRAIGKERDLGPIEIASCITYLKEHPEIREVILSGGDPLTLTDRKLDDLLQKLHSLSNIEIIRIGSRVPVVNPYRITKALCSVLKRYTPLFVNIHINHLDECTQEMKTACDRLVEAGIPLGSQTVLLRGVNDDPLQLRDLLRRLLQFRIRPYSLYHPDPVSGTQHFRTNVGTGRSIMEYLMANLSGLAIPHYVLDAPGGKGKIPVMRDYFEEVNPESITIQKPDGQRIDYIDGRREAK